jgi:hypothetical protein
MRSSLVLMSEGVCSPVERMGQPGLSQEAVAAPLVCCFSIAGYSKMYSKARTLSPSGTEEPAGAKGYQNSYQPQGFAIGSQLLLFPTGFPSEQLATDVYHALDPGARMPWSASRWPVLPCLRLRARTRRAIPVSQRYQYIDNERSVDGIPS